MIACEWRTVMRRTFTTFLILNTLVLAYSPDFDSPHHPSRVLVQFQPGANQAARQSAHEDAGALQILESV
jgi:hypothetical protein